MRFYAYPTIPVRFGSRTEELEASKLEDFPNPPNPFWEAEVLQNLLMDLGPPPIQQQPVWQSYLDKNRTTRVRTCHRFTPTGSKSTATRCPQREHRPSSSRLLTAPPNRLSLVFGRRSNRGSSTWGQLCRDSSLAPSLRRGAGRPLTLSPPVPIRLSQALSLKASLPLGTTRPGTAPAQEVEITATWIRSSPPTPTRCTGR